MKTNNSSFFCFTTFRDLRLFGHLNSKDHLFIESLVLHEHNGKDFQLLQT